MNSELINNCRIIYSNDDIILRDYKNYFIETLKNIIVKNEIKNINFIIGKIPYTNKDDRFIKDIKIDFQVEHTLVKPNGRNSENSIIGEIETKEDSNYLIRIPNLDYYNNLDMILEYSIPNIINISSSKDKMFENYLKKSFYFPPMNYEIDFEKSDNKKYDTITSFINTDEIRRKKFLNMLKLNKINNHNIHCFDKDDLKKIYKESKILLNIRQTDHHDTFEEIRVLPALLNGIIIVSEDVPLRKYIPYNEFIIWSDYNNIFDKVNEILNNYDEYYNKIFKNDELIEILTFMKIRTIENIEKFIKNNNY